MAVIGSASVIDLYHLDMVQDWSKAKADGVIGVIHKATEGISFRDPTYVTRRKAATDLGLLWGSYHFASGDDGAKQADYYLDYADPTSNDIVCLDVEPSSQPKHGPRVPNITYEQVFAFVTRINEKTGRLPMIYGGHPFLTNMMKGWNNSIVCLCPLWYAEYPASIHDRPQHMLPDGWSDWTLWQYAADGNGPEPRQVDGIAACDRDTFKGSADDLRLHWPFVRKLPASEAVA